MMTVAVELSVLFHHHFIEFDITIVEYPATIDVDICGTVQISFVQQLDACDLDCLALNI